MFKSSLKKAVPLADELNVHEETQTLHTNGDTLKVEHVFHEGGNYVK